MLSPQVIRSKISRLQHDRIVGLLESLCLFIVAFFFLGVIPQLIVRVLYPDQFPTELPANLTLFLENSPIAAVAISIVYFVAVLVRNFMRSRVIATLEQELERTQTTGRGSSSLKSDDLKWMAAVESSAKEWENGVMEETALGVKSVKSTRSGRKPGKKPGRKAAKK